MRSKYRYQRGGALGWLLGGVALLTTIALGAGAWYLLELADKPSLTRADVLAQAIQIQGRALERSLAAAAKAEPTFTIGDAGLVPSLVEQRRLLQPVPGIDDLVDEGPWQLLVYPPASDPVDLAEPVAEAGGSDSTHAAQEGAAQSAPDAADAPPPPSFLAVVLGYRGQSADNQLARLVCKRLNYAVTGEMEAIAEHDMDESLADNTSLPAEGCIRSGQEYTYFKRLLVAPTLQ